MKQLTTLISTLFFLVVGVSQVWALPACVGSRSINWHNCFGTYVWDNGDKYVGEFGNDQLNGQGTFTWGPNSEWAGDKYVGEHKDNKRHGQGTFTWGPNSEWAGDKYVGEHRDNKMNGQGVYTHAN